MAHSCYLCGGSCWCDNEDTWIEDYKDCESCGCIYDDEFNEEEDDVEAQ